MGMHKNEESLRVAMQENAAIYKEEDYEKRYEGFDPKDPDTYIALALRQSVFLNQSLEFGAQVQEEFRERVGRKDRGVKQAGYYVISFTTMPSVLVELGFLTNAKEEDFLNSPEGRESMADALFRAFRSYRANYHPDVREVTPAVAPAVSTAPAVRVAVPVEAPVTYRVQILASATRVPMNDARFGGRRDVIEYLRDGMFKYAVGAARSQDQRVSGMLRGGVPRGCTHFDGCGPEADRRQPVKLLWQSSPQNLKSAHSSSQDSCCSFSGSTT